MADLPAARHRESATAHGTTRSRGQQPLQGFLKAITSSIYAQGSRFRSQTAKEIVSTDGLLTLHDVASFTAPGLYATRPEDAARWDCQSRQANDRRAW